LGSDSNSQIEPHDLKDRILFKMRLGDTQGQLRTILKNQFSKAMAEEVTVMDRNQRKKLFTEVARIILKDTSGGLD
jgi:hypothetical protein